MPVPTEWICIDDEVSDKIEPLLTRLRRSPAAIQIRLAAPRPFDEQVDIVCRLAPAGVVADLRLDDVRPEGGIPIRYRAVSLAQELRTRMTEGMPSFPIVLWSSDAKLRESFNNDTSAHDLFDRVYHKGQLTVSAAEIAAELSGLSEGYRVIGAAIGKPKFTFSRLLALSEEHRQALDARVGDHLARNSGYPVHEHARYILRELIDSSGPLIDEGTLAARLGVDIVSSPDWEICKARATEFAGYRGPFMTPWRRWWSFLVDAWVSSIAPGPLRLRQMTATERVHMLRSTLSLSRLEPAAPIASGYSDRFWTECATYKRPLDPIDGVLVDRPSRRPWQDAVYTSLKAVLERDAARHKIRIDPLEHPRIEALIRRPTSGKRES